MGQQKDSGLSIFHRLLIAFLAVFTGLSMALSVLYFFFSRQFHEQYAQEAIVRELNEVKNYFDNVIAHELRRDLKLLALNPLLDEFLMSSDLNFEINARAVERLFLQVLQHTENVESISFVDYKGEEKIRVTQHGRSREYDNIAETQLFKQIEASSRGKISFSGPWMNPDGGYRLTIGAYKNDPDIGQFGGAVMVEYNLKAFFHQLSSMQILGENPFWLFTPDGHILQKPQSNRKILDPRPVFSDKIQELSPIFHLDNGLVAFSDLQLTDVPIMRVGVSVPSWSLLKDLRGVQRFLTIVFIVSLAAIVIIVYFVSKYLSRPIVELSGAVKNLPRKNLFNALDIKATGEVKVLVDSFNSMIRNMAETTVSKEYVDNIIQTMSNALFVLTPEGIIQTVNSTSCSLLGYDEAELIHTPMSEVCGRDVMNSLSRGVGDRSLEVLFRHKEGKDIPVLLSSNNMYDEDGNVMAIVCLAQDISDKKQAEEQNAILEAQLRQAQKMEAIGTLAGGIAHDFNNSLTAILGYAELAQLKNESGKPITEELNQVVKAGFRARDLVKQILAFSRASEHHLEPLSPHLIVKESLQLLRPSLPSTIQIEENIDKNCGLILADPTKIHQIMMNLCTNALHAMENEYGTLTINLACKELTSWDLQQEPNILPGRFVELTIRDTGHGIDAKTMERIFEPFFTTKEVGKGTGMGLAVIHGIVHDYGGIIRAESKPGSGSVFRVYFPVIEQEGYRPKDEIELNLPTGSEKILLIDDEATIVQVQKSALEALGYEVTGKTSSTEALEEFLSCPDGFDLIVTDQTMPGITGAALAKEVLSRHPGFPIILCTGYSSVISRRTADEIGIRKFLMKPVDIKKLAFIVREILDQPHTA